MWTILGGWETGQPLCRPAAALGVQYRLLKRVKNGVNRGRARLGGHGSGGLSCHSPAENPALLPPSPASAPCVLPAHPASSPPYCPPGESWPRVPGGRHREPLPDPRPEGGARKSRPRPTSCPAAPQGGGGAQLRQLSGSHGTSTSSAWLPGGEGVMNWGLGARQASGGAVGGAAAPGEPGGEAFPAQRREVPGTTPRGRGARGEWRLEL